MRNVVFLLLVLTVFNRFDRTLATPREDTDDSSTGNDVPEGYYAFIESPNAEPPRVRPPPYNQGNNIECPNDEDAIDGVNSGTANLCGDLNKGLVPRNPMGQNVMGASYPFVLIRNMTLRYLSRTLPILKADETLPKVAQMEDDRDGDEAIASDEEIVKSFDDDERDYYERDEQNKIATSNRIKKRSVDDSDGNNKTESPFIGHRKSRKFCDQGGVFCMIYKAINGGDPSQKQHNQQPSIVTPGGGTAERREDVLTQHQQSTTNNGPPKYEGPPTPCPARVEYATPVFARNYRGLWRYVVQIPYEGYFTQTVEVTRCLQSRCHYLDGGCLSTPRWSSLLVAEIYYPDTVLKEQKNQQRSPVVVTQPPSVQDFQNYQQYLHKRAGLQAAEAKETGASAKIATASSPQPHCDGYDNLGCFQVRLYYDWFLIPGSCKCWRPDYFNRYVRRKPNRNQRSDDL